MQPEPAAGAAAGDASALGADAQLPQKLERVAQAVGDALEDGAGERRAAVLEPEAGERGAGVRVGVRRPLAGEVREEQHALGAGLDVLGSREKLVVGRRPRRMRPGTSAASQRRRASHPSRARFRERRGRRRAGAPPAPARTRAAPRRRLRTCRGPPRAAPARRRRPPARRRPGPPLRRQPVSRSSLSAGDFGRLQGRGQPLGRELERLQHLGAPTPLGDVEQQRPRGIGHVGRTLTRKA